MTTVMITYKLAEGVTRDQYRKWSREVDQVIGSRQPGISRYEVFEMTDAGVGDRDIDVLEVIEADSVEAWEKVNGYDEMKAVYQEFLTIADPDSVTLLYGSQI